MHFYIPPEWGANERKVSSISRENRLWFSLAAPRFFPHSLCSLFGFQWNELINSNSPARQVTSTEANVILCLAVGVVVGVSRSLASSVCVRRNGCRRPRQQQQHCALAIDDGSCADGMIVPFPRGFALNETTWFTGTVYGTVCSSMHFHSLESGKQLQLAPNKVRIILNALEIRSISNGFSAHVFQPKGSCALFGLNRKIYDEKMVNSKLNFPQTKADGEPNSVSRINSFWPMMRTDADQVPRQLARECKVTRRMIDALW